jgi:hypothetical protein
MKTRPQFSLGQLLPITALCVLLAGGLVPSANSFNHRDRAGGVLLLALASFFIESLWTL